MSKLRNISIAAAISFIFLIMFNLVSFAFQCDEIRGDIIRLHVIANSDEEYDQALKLKVRDAVLQEGKTIFDGSVTIENAIEKITPEINRLQHTAETIINKNGYNYDVNVTLEKEYFDTRTYNNEITLPAGKYLALKVIIGNGNGKNWWCVMFPAMCLPAVTQSYNEALNGVFTNDETEIVTNKSKYKVKFKVVEWIEKLKNHENK